MLYTSHAGARNLTWHFERKNPKTAKIPLNLIFFIHLYVEWMVRVLNRDKQTTQSTGTAKYKTSVFYRMAGEWRKMQESLQLLRGLHRIWQLLSYWQVPYNGRQFLHAVYKFENIGLDCLPRKLLNNKILPLRHVCNFGHILSCKKI